MTTLTNWTSWYMEKTYRWLGRMENEKHGTKFRIFWTEVLWLMNIKTRAALSSNACALISQPAWNRSEAWPCGTSDEAHVFTDAVSTNEHESESLGKEFSNAVWDGWSLMKYFIIHDCSYTSWNWCESCWTLITLPRGYLTIIPIAFLETPWRRTP